MAVQKEQTIRQFIVDTFLFGQDDGLSVDDPLLESRILDSTGILELATFIGGHYGITVDDEEMLVENFGSIRAVAKFVERKQQGAG